MLLEQAEACKVAPASAARPDFLRRLFSFPAMLCVSLMMLAVLSVRDRFDDPDLWWHLRTGQIVWNTHSIPSIDIFSFTTNQHAWTAHEWLSQVLIFGAWHMAGYQGLMLLLCALTASLLLLQYHLSSLYSGNAKVALLGALIVWLFATVGMSLRPQLFGYLFLTIELLLLELGRRGDARWFLGLPLLFATWVNMHGSFILGLVVASLVLICACLDFQCGLLIANSWRPAKRKMLSASLALSVAALFVNPVGIRQLIYPLDVMFRQKLSLAVVTEWQPMAFTDPRSLALLLAAALVVLIPLVRRVPLYLHELVLTAAGFYLAVQHQRMAFVFGLLAAPVLCRLLADTWDGYDARRDLPIANAFMMTVFACGIAWGFPSLHQLDRQVRQANPVRAVAFLRSSGLSGNMLNEYGFGGYLIWAAPERKVFIDGRADVFDWTGVLKEFGEWASLQADPNDLLKKYHVSFCLLSAGSPMSRVMTLLPGWKQIYADDQALVFARAAQPN